ncbi:hypothetical protein CALCODRAFT_72598 [Calocera cornea HHB12733]|uniref:Secreted protein n=1 Tax=Calocera cornea HHB12733 TaxID=1353952 RepID=A0A165IT79_9BASI|nr:hypothetical protein CALCODRAFT_72598 [Calocera cornea HHB12733]
MSIWPSRLLCGIVQLSIFQWWHHGLGTTRCTAGSTRSICLLILSVSDQRESCLYPVPAESHGQVPLSDLWVECGSGDCATGPVIPPFIVVLPPSLPKFGQRRWRYSDICCVPDHTPVPWRHTSRKRGQFPRQLKGKCITIPMARPAPNEITLPILGVHPLWKRSCLYSSQLPKRIRFRNVMPPWAALHDRDSAGPQWSGSILVAVVAMSPHRLPLRSGVSFNSSESYSVSRFGGLKNMRNRSRFALGPCIKGHSKGTDVIADSGVGGPFGPRRLWSLSRSPPHCSRPLPSQGCTTTAMPQQRHAGDAAVPVSTSVGTSRWCNGDLAETSSHCLPQNAVGARRCPYSNHQRYVLQCCRHARLGSPRSACFSQ